MKEEKKITQSDIDRAAVKLHPIGGVPPRVYVPLGYGLILLFLLFLFLVLPGINKFGSYLVFDGTPAKSAVYIGDAYKGSTAQRIFLPAGEYRLRIEHEGFLAQTLDIQVGGRLIGSLPFPRKLLVDYGLSVGKPAELLNSAYREYGVWSLGGKPSALYQIPPVLSDAAAALAATGSLAAPGSPYAGASESAAAPGGNLPKPLDFARDVISATSSAESARDGLRASVLITSGGIPGPLTLVSAARVVAAALGARKAGAVWIGDLLPKAGLGGGAAPAATEGGGLEGGGAAPAPKPRASVSLGGHDFLLFSGGSLTLGGEAPSGSLASYAATVPAFGIAKTEVTNRQWAAFLAAEPEWKPENRSALIEAGLADDSYLTGWAGPDDLPVTGVSWYAAAAYCDWLSAKTGGAYQATLPSEAMWEAAARAGLSDPASIYEKKATWSDGERSSPGHGGAAGYSAVGIADLFGNVWEWTADTCRPYPAFAADILQGEERTVRGGSWANAPGSISLYSRGGQSASHASAFLGFRPAIVER